MTGEALGAGARDNKFGRRLALACKAAGYTSVIDVGAKVGISRESMRKYRTGARLPSAPLLIDLARTLNVTPGWLLGASAHEEAVAIVNADRIERAMRHAMTPHDGAEDATGAETATGSAEAGRSPDGNETPVPPSGGTFHPDAA